ncbi:type II restriction endonuclease [Spirochaetia bacterium]|nr:type II restriction endonuclease [Spirochaetia bacterium]
MPEIPIKQALNKAYIKARPEREAIERFKANFITLLDSIRAGPAETEEHLKNLVSDFLKKTWYDPDYNINTSARIDLVIHTGKTAATGIGVIIEAKRPGNKTEMISRTNLNAKAAQELLLYYLRETVDNNNLELKHLIITNTQEWYIFDARDFYHCFSQDKELLKLYGDFKSGSLLEKDNAFFYNQIAAPSIQANEQKLNYTYFNIAEYEKIIRSSDKEADNKLISLYKLLSPAHLLKLPFANDSNSLNQNFYSELLYIMGLSEDKEGGKKIIVRNKPTDRQEGSLLENTIFRLSDYNLTENELFEYALELVITWINRILFLKLLESQQIQYQKGNPGYAFLNTGKVKNYSDLHTLFFNVLAKRHEERGDNIKKRYGAIPYLNSSLFDMTPMEKTYFSISNLPEAEIGIYSGTVLKQTDGKKRAGKINTLEYIFEFLNAYDFSSEGSESIQEENKTLINAAVLGLIFEKINGYKDGSYFTPGFITTYICREVIRNVVINKFNEAKGWTAQTLDDVFNKIEDIPEANKIINSITICDPAVGSGHFLVSALNEIIAIKSDLGVLADSKGRRLKGYKVEVVNDELMVFDENGDFYTYNYRNEESRRIQETVFQEKRRIIENCLFGVDINPNSVKICRLRLWIELLKNAYYTAESNYTELETLPNIDINIKCGNSLISRFDLDIDLKAELKKLKYTVKDYQEAVYQYKNAVSKDEKAKLDTLILDIKNNFRGEAEKHTKLNRNKYRLHAELAALSQQEFFDLPQKEKEKKDMKISELSEKIAVIDRQIEEINTNKIYDNAFEWRFEFPEVLNDDGDFMGFDAVIGNPPYIFTRDEGFTEAEKAFFYTNFKYQDYQLNTFTLFTENGYNLVKAKGSFGYIMPNNWLTISSDKKFRDFIVSNSSNLMITNNLHKVFIGANVDTSILIFEKNTPNYVTLIESSSPDIYNVISRQNYKNLLSKSIIHIRKQDNGLLIVDRINSQSCSLDNLVVVSTGLKAYQIGKGKPLQTKEDKENRVYHSTKKINKSYGKYLQGVDVKRYALTWSGEYLSYGDWLAEPRKSVPFKGPRILIRQIPSALPYMINAVYTDEPYYNDINSMVIFSDDKECLKYILGILNSKAISFWFNKEFDKMQRNIFPQFKVNELKTFPVPMLDFSKKVDIKKRDKLVVLVDKMLELKAGERLNAAQLKEIQRLDDKIDKFVYELYNLTEEEIRIIENPLSEANK